MERNTKELISAAYTVYSLLNPADRVVVSIDSFADAFAANISALEVSTVATSDVNTKSNAQSSQLSLEKAESTLEKGFSAAEDTIDDKEKLTSMLEKLKQKMKSLPMVGSVLANVPTMFRLLNSYLKEEYTDIPRKQLIIIVSTLSYLISPIDLVPDFIPVIGLMDDMAIISVCVKSTKPELEKYLSWRNLNGLTVSPEVES